MLHRNGRKRLLAYLAAGGLLALPAMAEPVLSAYGGWAGGMTSNDSLTDTSLPDLDLPNSSGTGAESKQPVHYGARFSYWTGDNSRWGLSGDYTRATTVARLTSAVSLPTDELSPSASGPGGSRLPLEVRDIRQTHDLVTLNGIFRWLEPGSGADHPRHWLVPYLGLGLGMAVSPVKDEAGSSYAFRDRLTGPAAQGLVGGEVLVGGRWSMFVEYKMSWTDLSSQAPDGSSLALEPWTQHFALGLSMKF